MHHGVGGFAGEVNAHVAGDHALHPEHISGAVRHIPPEGVDIGVVLRLLDKALLLLKLPPLADDLVAQRNLLRFDQFQCVYIRPSSGSVRWVPS